MFLEFLRNKLGTLFHQYLQHQEGVCCVLPTQQNPCILIKRKNNFLTIQRCFRFLLQSYDGLPSSKTINLLFTRYRYFLNFSQGRIVRYLWILTPLLFVYLYIDFSPLCRYGTHTVQLYCTTSKIGYVSRTRTPAKCESCYQILWWGREERLADHFSIDVSRTVGPAWKNDQGHILRICSIHQVAPGYIGLKAIW